MAEKHTKGKIDKAQINEQISLQSFISITVYSPFLSNFLLSAIKGRVLVHARKEKQSYEFLLVNHKTKRVENTEHNKNGNQNPNNSKRQQPHNVKAEKAEI